jgi:predicted MFS family arabinose efflux permease
VVGVGGRGRLLDLLRRPEVWPVLAMMVVCYAPAAGLRGLWLGPYFTQVHGFTAGQVGTAGLWMGLAMVAGNFAYGPLDRLLGTRKGLILGGNLVTLVALGLLWGLAPGPGVAVALFMAVGFFGASFPMVVAHGRAFFPPHLVGRGVTLLNLFGIAPIGLAQLATGRLHAAAADPAAGHAAVFLFFALALALGLAAYLPARDRTD